MSDEAKKFNLKWLSYVVAFFLLYFLLNPKATTIQGPDIQNCCWSVFSFLYLALVFSFYAFLLLMAEDFLNLFFGGIVDLSKILTPNKSREGFGIKGLFYLGIFLAIIAVFGYLVLTSQDSLSMTEDLMLVKLGIDYKFIGISIAVSLIIYLIFEFAFKLKEKKKSTRKLRMSLSGKK